MALRRKQLTAENAQIRLENMCRRDCSINEEALDTIEEDVYKRILKGLMKAKARSLKEGNTFEGRTKLYRFALARGFESSLIAPILNSGELFEERGD